MIEINQALVFGIATAAWVIYRSSRAITTRRIGAGREVLTNLFFIYMLEVISVTFFPMRIVLYAFDAYDANLIPFVETIRMLHYTDQPGVMLNLAGNLALLAPLGIFLPVLFMRVRKFYWVLGIGLLVSLGIEVSQLWLRVRIFDVDDILINLLGVVIGYCIFALISKIHLIARFINIFAGPRRAGSVKAFTAYAIFAVVAFLSVFAVSIGQQTQTEAMITRDLAAAQRQVLGIPRFGEFIMVFSQSEDGLKDVDVYRRIFFDRYTVFKTHHDLQLGQNVFTVSGMSTGHEINYFVIARTDQVVAAMVSYDLTLPVEKVDGYIFSYATESVGQQPERFFSFRFVNSKGDDLGLKMEPQ